jgi:hypothetical protein
LKKSEVRPGDESPHPSVANPGEPSTEKIFGKPINAIDVPPGFRKRTVRIADAKGAIKWIEIEERAETSVEAKTVVPLTTLPAWVVPVGDISPEATRDAKVAVASSAKVDTKRNEVLLPLPKGLGTQFKISYSTNGNHWKDLGVFPAGKLVEKRRNPKGFYQVQVVSR